MLLLGIVVERILNAGLFHLGEVIVRFLIPSTSFRSRVDIPPFGLFFRLEGGLLDVHVLLRVPQGDIGDFRDAVFTAEL